MKKQTNKKPGNSLKKPVFASTQRTMFEVILYPESFVSPYAKQEDHPTIADQIKCSISHLGDVVYEWGFNLHDKDLNEDLTPKKPHYHVELHFSVAVRASRLVEAFGLTTVGDDKKVPAISESTRSRFEYMLAYLVHHMQKGKYQYDPNYVVSHIVGEDNKIIPYPEWLAAYALGEDKRSGASKMGSTRKVNSVEDLTIVQKSILQKLSTGELPFCDLESFVSPIDYIALRPFINSAKEYFYEVYQPDTNFKKEVYYFYGDTATGKTFYAHELAKAKNMSFFSSAGGKNKFDDYRSEKFVVLNDSRPEDYKLADWLRILDPYDHTPFSARYKNRKNLAEIIVITSPMPLDEFCSKIPRTDNDSVLQFQRRISCVMHFDYNKIYTSLFDYDKMCFTDTVHIQDNKWSNKKNAPDTRAQDEMLRSIMGDLFVESETSTASVSAPVEPAVSDDVPTPEASPEGFYDASMDCYLPFSNTTDEPLSDEDLLLQENFLEKL